MKSVVVYADESGTHDKSGELKGSQFPTIAGFAAPPSVWSSFCTEWHAVLNSYSAPYFHFSEWAAASAAIRLKTKPYKNNPYSGWDLNRLDKFLYTLAEIAAHGNKAPIAGVISVDAFNRIKAKLDVCNPEGIQLGTDPFKFSMGEFFRVYHKETWIRWGDFKCPVAFFFDQSDNPKWISALHEVYAAFSAKDRRMSGISFVNKTDPTHLPLQAADMLAYRLRQAAHNLHTGTYNMKRLDHILLKGLLRSAANASPELRALLNGRFLS